MIDLGTRLLLDLRGVEQRRYDCGGPDSNCNTRLHQLGAALLVLPVALFAHPVTSMAFVTALEVA